MRHSSSTALVGLLAVLDPVSAHPTSSSSAAAPADPTGTSFPSGFDITRSWANLSPYQDAPGFSEPKGMPRGCELTQAHVLHRHAQRYPTESDLDGGGMEAFAKKLKNYEHNHQTNKIGHGPLSFLDDWEYLLGQDLLLPTGAATEATSGANIWSRYGRLLYHAGRGQAEWDESLNVFPNGTARPKPIFRTTDQERILESARWWLSMLFVFSSSSSVLDIVFLTRNRWILRQHRRQQLLLAIRPGDYPRRQGNQQQHTGRRPSLPG